MAQGTCSVEGCERAIYCKMRGWCRRHYERWKAYGDPLGKSPKQLREEARYKVILSAAFAEVDDCIIPFWHRPNRQPPFATVNGRRTFAARLVWIERFGDPGRLMVLHRCNGGSGLHGCINVRHLYLGDHSDNIRDAYASGHRKPSCNRGEAAGKAILTEQDVLEVRRLSAMGVSYEKLAERFGCAKPTIANVVTRATWKHI